MKIARRASILFLLLAAPALMPPLLAQQNTYPITGSASIDAGYALDSSASGGPFSYRVRMHNIFPSMGFCTPGQPCTLDTRIGPFVIFNPPFVLSMSGALGNLLSPWVQSEVQIMLPLFITPEVPPDSSYEMKLPATLTGTVSAWYQDQTSGTVWNVWTATLKGSGTAELLLYNFGAPELRPVGLTLSYTGTATTSVKVPWIPAPDSAPSGIAYNGHSLFVSDVSVSGLTTINQLNPSTGDVLRSLLSPSPGGFDGRGNPSDLTYSHGHLFVSDVGTEGSGRVYEIAPEVTKIFDSWSLPFRGGAITSDDERLFVGDLDSSQMLVISRSGRSLQAFSGGLRPAGMVFDGRNNLLWVIDQHKTGVVSQVTTKGVLLRTCAGPWSVGDRGLGGIALLGDKLGIAEISGFQREELGRPGTISLPNRNTLTCSPALPLTVRLDIKPGSFPNTVNPKSNSMLSVAVLGTAKFQAATIDPATLRFGQTGLETPAAHWKLGDFNNDGYSDLLVQFRTRQADLSCGVTLASVTGRTYAGKEIRGTDSVKLLGCD